MNFYLGRLQLSVIFIAYIASGQLYDSSLYSLGPNIITNPVFAEPALAAGLSGKIISNSAIPGWSCSIKCWLANIPLTCQSNGLTCSNNYTQAVDLISKGTVELVTQDITITSAASYLFSVEWMIPTMSPLGKFFQIKINNVSL